MQQSCKQVLNQAKWKYIIVLRRNRFSKGHGRERNDLYHDKWYLLRLSPSVWSYWIVHEKGNSFSQMSFNELQLNCLVGSSEYTWGLVATEWMDYNLVLCTPAIVSVCASYWTRQIQQRFPLTSSSWSYQLEAKLQDCKAETSTFSFRSAHDSFVFSKVWWC